MQDQAIATRELTRFAHELDYADIPAEALKATGQAIMDNIGCALGGADTELARSSLKLIGDLGGTPQATVFGQRHKSSTALAAFQNGIQANALDYDDAFEQDGKGMGHPGSTIIPAAFAVGEQAGATGEQMVAAIVAGYEATNRIIQAIQPTPERHKQVWGVAVHQTFGASVAVAKLLRLSLDELRNAFGLAATFSPLPAARKWNWQERPLATPKDVTASPAETGIRTAMLAANGWQGSRDILDGPSGFWVMAGSDRCNAALFTDQLGTRWTVTELSFKPYPACRWVHTALEAAEKIVQREQLSITDIDRIDVGTFTDVVNFFNDRRPRNMVDAEFSLPWPMAMTLLGRAKGSDWYTNEALADPEVHAMADRVFVHKDDEAQRLHYSDERKTMSVVTITARDGRQMTERLAVARGGMANPWIEGDLETKFSDLAAPVIGSAATSELQDRLLALGRENSLSRICHLAGGDTS